MLSMKRLSVRRAYLVGALLALVPWHVEKARATEAGPGVEGEAVGVPEAVKVDLLQSEFQESVNNALRSKRYSFKFL